MIVEVGSIAISVAEIVDKDGALEATEQRSLSLPECAVASESVNEDDRIATATMGVVCYCDLRMLRILASAATWRDNSE